MEKKAQKRPSETTPYRDRLSTIITLNEKGKMRESGRGSLTRVPHSGLCDTTQSREISTNIISRVQGSMIEELPDFRGLSALLIGNKAERPGKHLQLTKAFSLGPSFHIGCMGLGWIQHLEPRNKVS